jgi:hypothetical protein
MAFYTQNFSIVLTRLAPDYTIPSNNLPDGSDPDGLAEPTFHWRNGGTSPSAQFAGYVTISRETSTSGFEITIYDAGGNIVVAKTGIGIPVGTSHTGMLFFAGSGPVFDKFGGGTFFVTNDSAESAAIQASSNGHKYAVDSYDWLGCFLQGTRILTRGGYRPVESLSAGEEVLTLGLGWQPIRWIGHSEVRRNWIGRFPRAHYPIRIRAGAFGAGLPQSDLCLSPKHAVFFQNHLIPAESLINGLSVVRDQTVEALESFKYCHVLLDQHAVIFSEGLPTESYVPFEDYSMFDNGDTCPEIFRQKYQFSLGTYEECYPRVEKGTAVEAARAYLSSHFDTAPARSAA